MLTFLFWNLNKRSLLQRLSSLVYRHEVDFLILAECAISPEAILAALNRGAERYSYAPGIGCDKIWMFSRFSPDLLKPIEESERVTIRHVTRPHNVDFLLVGVHLASKMYWQDASQAMECPEIANMIRLTEERLGHSRTIVIGDFNMNPFEDGIVSAGALHAVMSRKVAERRSRIIGGKEYTFFYNPMWGFFGDRTASPPGTFYYSRSERRVFFWNMYDQVLLRPDLLPMCRQDSVEIIHSDGADSFLTAEGLPNRNLGSDHLPIVVKLDL